MPDPLRRRTILDQLDHHAHRIDYEVGLYGGTRDRAPDQSRTESHRHAALRSDSWPQRALALCREGYEPGRTPFVCDFEPDNVGDYREIARSYLRPAIDQALTASGSPRVDIIARSMGGLVA